MSTDTSTATYPAPDERWRATGELTARVRACADPEQRHRLLEEMTQVNLRVAEVLAAQIAAGRLSSTRTQQMAYLALARATRAYDVWSGVDFLAASMPRLRHELQHMVSVQVAPRDDAPHEPAGRPADGDHGVQVYVEQDSVRVTGLSADDVVRRLKRGHFGETRVAVHTDGRGAPGDEAPVHDLSVREVEIVRRIAAGMSNRELAASLFLGVNTVKTYIRTAYRKMGVTSRSQAVMWAVRNGLGPDGPRPVGAPHPDGSALQVVEP